MGEVEGNPVLTRAARERLVELEREWAALRAEVEQLETAEVEAFNRVLQQAGIPGVIAVRKPTGRVM
jgi:hypothetical protein